MLKAETSNSILDCCFSEVGSKSATAKKNLFTTKQYDNCEKLLYLYRWLESNGKNLNFYPNIISTIKEICPTVTCCETEDEVTEGLSFTVKLVCSDDILADSFIIYT